MGVPIVAHRAGRFTFVPTKLTPVDFIQPAYCSPCGRFLSMIERAGGTLTTYRFTVTAGFAP
jgi:hypothetical protein